MKAHIWMPMMAMILCGASAQAVEPSGQKLYRFNFECNFSNGKSCTALSTVYAYVDSHGGMTSPDGRYDISNKLAIECEGTLHYANGAYLYPKDKVVVITGIEGTPVIVVKRNGDLALTPLSEHDATLKFDHKRLDGTCTVEREPVYDTLRE